MANPNGPVDQLKALLGFDPTKNNPNAEVLGQAMKEIRGELAASALVKAKDLLKKGMELVTKRDQLVKEFNGKLQKFDKELGQVVRAVTAMSNNEAPAEEQADAPAAPAAPAQ